LLYFNRNLVYHGSVFVAFDQIIGMDGKVHDMQKYRISWVYIVLLRLHPLNWQQNESN
jgi:hypothetical protein